MDRLSSEANWRFWMEQALDQAGLAAAAGEVPIGAVLVDGSGGFLASAGNQPIACKDPTAHAEIRVLRQAAQITGNYRLPGTVLISTVEPCLMCTGALIQARISGLVYGTDDPKAGAIVSRIKLFEDFFWLNHRFWVIRGILATRSRALLQAFFAAKRNTDPAETQL